MAKSPKEFVWKGRAFVPTVAEQERRQIAEALRTCDPTKPFVTLRWKIREEHANHLRAQGYLVEMFDAKCNPNTLYIQREETVIRLVPDRLAALVRDAAEKIP